jgi:O-antigen/teichoic acid export membrane protein
MLGPDGRGVFAAAQIWPMIIAGLAFFGANHALTLRAATYQGERGGLYGAALALGSVLSVVALAAGAIAIPLLLENRDVQAAALLFLWQIPIFILTSLLVSVDVGLGRFGPYNVGRWILASTYFGIVLALAVFGVRSPQAYLNGLLAANAASLVFLLANVPWRSLTVRSPHVKALIEGGRFQAATVALLARDQIERLFVLYALSLEDLGQYVVAYSAAMMPAVLAKSLGLIVFSRSAIAGKTGAYEDTGRLFRQLFALNVAITAGSAVVLPCLIPLFYGDGFAPAGRIALILVFGQLAIAAFGVLDEGLRGQNRAHLGAIANVLMLASFLAAADPMAGAFGAMGVAMAAVAGHTIALAFLIVVFKRSAPSVPLLPRMEDMRALARIARDYGGKVPGLRAVLARLP